MKNSIKEACCLIVFLVVLCATVSIYTEIATPKRYDFGAMWGQFLEEEENSIDIMFFGSSLVYCDIIPAVIYEDSGIAAYLMAGPGQNIPTTYYYIKEALKTQQPETIFFEITGMFFPEQTEFNLINVGYMPWGMNRISATFQGASRDEWLGLLFPLYIYHDRFEELTAEDLTPYEIDMLAGYTFLEDIMDASDMEERAVDYDEGNYQKNLAYIEKIVELTADNGIDLVFYVTPSHRRLNQKYVDQFVGDTKHLGIPFIDFNEDIQALQVDPSTDFYDPAHFNYRGAEKYSHYMARFIAENHRPRNLRGDPLLWSERAAYYYSIEKPEE